MSKWETPKGFKSDGCTWPTLLNDLLGRDRNKKFCRRHDFECRHSTHDWKDARDYMLKGIRGATPLWLRWRIPVIWLGLTVFVSACRDNHTELPIEWEEWRNRDYEL